MYGIPGIRHLESQWLNAIDVIGIIANNPRHAGLPDLFQLAEGERALLAQAEVVEELVALLQPRKLVPDDALEHRAEDGVFVRCLEETAQIKIDVIHRFVDAPSKEQIRTFSFLLVCVPHLIFSMCRGSMLFLRSAQSLALLPVQISRYLL